jgi:hypothetical protein
MMRRKFKPSFPFREGDEILFGRGDNTYSGAVKEVMIGALAVIAKDLGGRVTVYYQDVLALVTPVITEKEEDALRALYEHGTLTVAEAKEAGLPLTGRVLTNLRERGLVTDFREGVTSKDAASWQVANEYEQMIYNRWYA